MPGRLVDAGADGGRDRHPDGLRQRRQGRLDARLGRHDRDGRLDLHGLDGEEPHATSTSTSRAASARRAARARAGCCGCSTRIEAGEGTQADIDLLFKVADSIGGKTVCPFGDARDRPAAVVAREVPRRVRLPRAREALLEDGRADVRAGARARAARRWAREPGPARGAEPGAPGADPRGREGRAHHRRAAGRLLADDVDRAARARVHAVPRSARTAPGRSGCCSRSPTASSSSSRKR